MVGITGNGKEVTREIVLKNRVESRWPEKSRTNKNRGYAH